MSECALPLICCPEFTCRACTDEPVDPGGSHEG
jgi:hypothetical protein